MMQCSEWIIFLHPFYAVAMTTGDPKANKKLLVILIDGFRWDYFDKFGLDLPGFKKLFNQGVKSEYMVPDFPTLSFPNYQTTMTGQHVDDHGFVGNFMYHPEFDHSFEINMKSVESNYSHWFEGAEPFWITAVKQKKRTYLFEWPGCHVSNNGLTSTFHDPVKTWPLIPQMESNLKKAVQLFKEDKIDMAGVFVDSIDLYGHSYGPNSKELKDTVQQLDNVILDFMRSLEAESLIDNVNIVVFSDHGMTEISEARTIDTADYINTNDVLAIKDKGAVCSIWPKDGKLEKVYFDLKKCDHKHFTVYKKEELPDRWHFKTHKLVAPIIVVADLGWYILTPEGREIDVYLDGPCKGHHGYDNSNEDMRGIFLASGPDFKTDYKAGPIRAVDIYQVMCKALDVKPQPNRGSWSAVRDIFKD